ncbi:MAG: rod shape-determining protein MreD [Phycisphaerae bacterium]|jgi:rod shape-determining protein MreD|nr:rod shape-determining protein MreD [Phycisphaerae bacterium]
MRWVGFAILVYVTLLVQTTVAAILFRLELLGPIVPDLAAIVAVFIALSARRGPDAMIAAWILGLGMDLMICGGGGAQTAVGPMAIAYALSAALVYRVREAFFYDRPLAQVLLTVLFCLAAHLGWVTLQTLLGFTWSGYGSWLLKAVGISLYTAVLAPFVCLGLKRCGRWFLVTPVGRQRQR